jgi:crotonobetainyl-CoA:carnitine CoA-transferase CaiB-like acyl-CoA transferase
MTNATAKIYSSMSSAKRGALRAQFANPVFTKTADGKIAVMEAAKKRGRVATISTSAKPPVAAFREMFQANFGKVARGELIKLAVSNGIAKNTAATFYQKFKAAGI